MKNYLSLILFSFICGNIYSQNKYLFPINTNSQNYLSGTMGELRGDHFHMGIDIKTFGKTGHPVYASENGYIERIRVSASGYGKAIYIKHLDGKKTVYAHLNRFNKKIDDYVTNYQYRKKHFSVNIYPGKKFFINKGEVIAYSGNTGSSSGPHLHFELRDSLDNVYDPLKLKFNEIIDNTKPTIEKITFKTLDKYSRINNGYGIFEYQVLSDKGKNFIENINAKGKIGISILCYDKLDGASNKNGIKKIELYVNNTLVVNNNIEYLTYDETNNVAKYIDFNLFLKSRKQYIKLYQDDGNVLNFHNNDHSGILNINEEEVNNIKIKIYDSYENNQEILFSINNSNTKNLKNKINLSDENFEIYDNILQISTSNNRNFLEIEVNKSIRNINPSYALQDKNFYLIDLTKVLPSKIILNDKVIDLSFIDIIPSETKFEKNYNDFSINVSKISLFDTLFLSFKKKLKKNNEIFEFKNLSTFKKNIEVTLIPKEKYDINKSYVYEILKNDKNFIGGKWNSDNSISFKTNNLSKYTLLNDTIGPEITPLKINSNQIKIRIKDDLSGINKYEGKINNNWILFEYDSKNEIIISKKFNPNQSFKGKFVLVVYDNANNKTSYNINI